jgi:protein-tyrosine phosphatase
MVANHDPRSTSEPPLATLCVLRTPRASPDLVVPGAHPRAFVSMRILFVCMGNICRSPTAEGVFRRLVQTRAPDLNIEIDSAGTHSYHVGDPPDPRMVAAAMRRGIDLSALRARTVRTSDFEYYDLILAMDEENLAELLRRSPPAHRRRLRLMMDYAPAAVSRAVPDPYYGGAQGFEDVLDLLEEAAEGLLRELLAR